MTKKLFGREKYGKWRPLEKGECFDNDTLHGRGLVSGGVGGFAHPPKFWLGGAEYPWHPPIIELNFFFNSLFFEHSQTKFSVLINKYFFVSF